MPVSSDAPRVSFRAMADGTPADFALIAANDADTQSDLPQRLIDHLLLAKGDDGAYQIDRLDHALQAAHRAEIAGADDDWVFGILMHDIGDTLSPDNHATVAADLIEPYVRPEVTWVVAKHGVFQGHYYWAHIGRDGAAREQYRDHPWFEHGVAFCHLYDQNSFDPDYPTPIVEHFRALIERVCARNPFSHTKAEGIDAMGIGPNERIRYREVLETRVPR